MLTGSSNYFGQDYLEPLPSTYDAKSSPLALLAATCNNIGKDESAKSIIPPIERKDKHTDRDGRHSNSPLERNLSHDSCDSRGISPKDSRRRDKSPTNIDIKPAVNQDRNFERSPLRKTDDKTPKDSPKYSETREDLKRSSSISSKISLNCGSLSVEINHKESSGSSNQNRSSSAHRSPSPRHGFPSHFMLPPTSTKSGSISGHNGLLSTYYPHLGLPGYALYPPSPLAGSASLYQRHAGSPKSEAPHVPVTYATVRTASGLPTLVPVCADPLCSQCKVAMEAARMSPSAGSHTCPPGCTQCTKDKMPHLSPAHLHGLPTGLGLFSLPGYSHGLHAAASLYGSLGHEAHKTSEPPAGQMVCNWVGGGKYCGERFNSSEELMTHLRTHTSSLESSSLASSLMSASAYASLPPSVLSSLGYLHPPSLSPNSLLRNAPYPGRSSSPNSLLSSRFHPYFKSPLPGLPSSVPSGSLPSLPSNLGPYHPLYGFPGSRLGPLVP